MAFSICLYRLERLQRKSARFTISKLLVIKTLGWESLEDRRKKLRVQLLYKIINKLVILSSTPLSRMEPSCYDLRDFNNLRINSLFCRTDTYKYSFYISSSNQIMEQPTLTNF